MESPKQGLALPLDIRGTAFQQKVWKALTRIPVGRTLSYSELAEKIGEPSAVRAVASACAANRIAVAIPVIAWCARMADFPAIAGASSARRRC